MTVKINNIHIASWNPLSLLEKMEKPAKLAKDSLQSFSQNEKKRSCHWLIAGMKRFCEKLLSILRCIFCCKYKDKQKDSTANKTESKPPIHLASTTFKTIQKAPKVETQQKKENPFNQAREITTESTSAQSNKQEIPIQEAHPNQIFGNFELMPTDLKGLIAEYVDDHFHEIILYGPDRMNFAKSYKDLSKKTFEDLLKELEKRDALYTHELRYTVEKLKELYQAFSGQILNDAYELVFRHCKNLKTFHLTDYDKDQLVSIAKSLPSSVVVYFPTTINDEELEIFSKNCPGLYGVYSAWCSSFTSNGLQALPKNCKQLQMINFDNCQRVNDAVLHAFAGNCKQLKKVCFRCCLGMTDKGLQEFLTNCSQLQELDLFGTMTNDTVLQAIGANCKQLKKLDLWNCKQITSNALIKVLESCSELEELILDHETMTDEVARALAKYCKKLQKIDLADCSITDAGMKELAKCPELRSISLRYCKRITNAGLLELANCKHLENIYQTCPQITHEGSQAFRELFHKLQEHKKKGSSS